MKRFFISICIILYTLPVYSLSSYSATYNLYSLTNLGSIKLGIAKYELILANQVYVFNSSAEIDLMWRALYDFSANEISIGSIKDNLLIGSYYKINEKKGESLSENYELSIYPEEQYVSFNNEINWKANSNNIVDALSVYLHISQDVQKDPKKKVFSYQIVDKKGINSRDFFIEGFETINIENNEIETIRINSPELRLVFNISKEHNFMPVNIEKSNGKSHYRLILEDFNQQF
jgi:hypothetical protein